MPFPNEHAARQLPPGDFKSFRRVSEGFPKGISAIIGIRANGKTAVQSLRFDKTIWSASAAKKWLRDHGFKTSLFEPAATPVKKLWGNVL